MSTSVCEVTGIEALDDVCQQYGLSADDYCLVGSATLAARGLRENGDLDVCFSPNIIDKVNLSAFEELELAPNKYEHMGLSDAELVSTDRYYDIIDGYPIIRPELEYSHKRVRDWKKDQNDIELLEQYQEETNDWNSELERHEYTPGPRHLVRRGFVSLRENGVRETLNHGSTYLRWHGPLPRRDSDYSGQPTAIPGKALMSLREDGIRTTVGRGIRLVKLKEPTGLLDRYSRIRHKAKVGTLIERKLETRYPTPELLLEQYDGNSFMRMDIVVRLLAAEAMLTNENPPPIVDTFEARSGQFVLEPTRKYVDAYEIDPVAPTVPVGYDSSVLDPNTLAVALAHSPESVPVRIASGTSRPAYPINWFEQADVPESELERLETRYTELLYESNALFPFILWPPAREHTDEIIEQLREEKQIHFTRKLHFDDEEFSEFVWALYESQADLNPKHIETKIDQMSEYEKVVTVGVVEVPNPRIREGFSNEVLQMKERVRERFTPKTLTDNPSANLLIHATDNFNHNRETRRILERYNDGESLFSN